nr:MAG TPA: hypothetical protein [Caudoviricetes sp.]
MSVVTREDLFNRIKTRIGDDTSDEAIALIEDFSDTFDSMSNVDNEDWRIKYEENDRQWRERYISRFENPIEDSSTETTHIPEEETEEKEVTIDDLFE